MAGTLRVIRILVACTPAAMGLVFVRAGTDVFTTPKATVAVMGAILVVALALVAWRSAQKRGGTVVAAVTSRTDAAYVSMSVAVVALLIAAATAAPSPLRSLVGDAGRHSGVAVWTAAVVLSVAAMVAARLDGGGAVMSTTVAASVPISLYALVQAAGRDPFTWSVIEGGPQVFATFGNADYLSAWLAMAIPLAVAVALGDTWPVTWRLLGAIAAMLGFAAAVATGSLQGPIGGVAGTAFVIAAWVTDDGWAARTRRRAALGTAVLVGVVLAAAVVGSPAGEASLLSSASRSLETRAPIWTAAWRMAASSPLVGVGPGHFSDEWFAMRPDEAVPPASGGQTTAAAANALPADLAFADVGHAVASPGAGERPVDDAHAIWLHLAATAGWPAAALWAAIVVMSVMRAARTLEGRSCSSRIRLAGLLGAVMAAVTVQSVSVDTASVTVTAWLLVGALNGASSANPVPAIGRGARSAHQVPPQWPSGETATAPPSPVTTPAGGPFNIAVAVVATAGILLAAVPMGAGLVAGAAGAPPANANATGDENQAWERHLRLASGMAPWERRYPAMLAARYAEAGRFEAALEAQRDALSRAPGDRAAALDTARLTAVVEGAEAAVGAYGSVLAIDGRTPDVLMEAGVNALRGGRPKTAVQMIERAVARAPDEDGWTSLLQQARAAATLSTGA